MKTIEQIKFKQKDLIIRKLGIDYKKIKFLNNGPLLIYEAGVEYLEVKKDITYYNELKEKVDYILKQMDTTLSQLIYNEFFSNKVEKCIKILALKLKNRGIRVRDTGLLLEQG